ncbi:peptidase M20 domain-containing protein 2-like [Tubulanus polymorphus]|uniref:peptidase M20 domain-containing protein 2-like n=1 Tax=Tubulanus polymorphus TaxID=672921 RepID=UPI003DA221D0
MDRLKESACKQIERLAPRLKSISDSLWERPELGFKEVHANKILVDFLFDEGFSVAPGFVHRTGFKADFSNLKGGPRIGFLCEYDALPDIGHACGHNLVAEVSIAAAKATQVVVKEAGLAAEIVVFGCPAEEGYGGKIDMVRKGAFKDIDIALMAHTYTHDVVCPHLPARITAEVNYTGKCCHAIGAPWQGINALDAVVMAYQSLSHLRQHIKPSNTIHAIITKGGTRLNIIPHETTLQVELRADTMDELTELKRRVIACLQGSALQTGCKVVIDFANHEMKYNLLKNEALSRLYESNGKWLKTSFRSDDYHQTNVMGSSDTGNVSHVVPTIQPAFSVDTDAAIHSTDFMIKAGLPEAQWFALRAAKALAMTALDVIKKPEFLELIKADFDYEMRKDEDGSTK